ncbi:MAG: hypothetical protein ABJQ14_14160 [Hyphomicrobiales bacterium]
MLSRLFSKKKRIGLMERTYRELPGYSVPTVDDVRFQVLEFEKLVKNYIQTRAGELPNEPLGKLINEVLPAYPRYPELEDHWPTFVEEAKLLRKYRNSIVHSDFGDLPEVSELYRRFKKANQTLLPFKICSGDRSRFKPICWKGETLEIKIDQEIYTLDHPDINNLLSELDPSSRGRVHFCKGRLVASKVMDYFYEKITYFIEDHPPFELSHDEAMVLEDVIQGLVGRRLYGDKTLTRP